jgi:AcrR family transcriptional regulator
LLLSVQVGGDDAVGDLGEVSADHVRPLDQGIQHLARAGDEGGGAPGPKRSGDVPGVRGDQAHLADRHPQPLGGHPVGLSGGLEPAHAVGRQHLVEQTDQTGVLQLGPGDLQVELVSAASRNPAPRRRRSAPGTSGWAGNRRSCPAIASRSSSRSWTPVCSASIRSAATAWAPNWLYEPVTVATSADWIIRANQDARRAAAAPKTRSKCDRPRRLDRMLLRPRSTDRPGGLVPRITAQARHARRQDLIDATWRLLAHTGWRDLTVDDVCAEAGTSKGAFYGYFDRKQDLLLALLDDEATAVEIMLGELAATELPTVERVRRFARAMLQRAADPARVQLRADTWAALAGEAATRERFAATVTRQRVAVRGLIERGIQAGELVDVPANAVASILLALTEGLVLHGSLDPKAFRWANVYRALDAILDGVQASR